MAVGEYQSQPETLGRVGHDLMGEAAVGRAARLPVERGGTLSSAHPPRRLGRAARTRMEGFAFVLPAAALMMLLVAYPLLRVMWDSMHNVDLVDPTATGFSGFDNYITVLTADEFLPALWHTAVWTVLSVLGEYALGLISALALAQPIVGRSVFRGIIVVPWVIPIVVAGLTWSWMLAPDFGITNAWLMQWGIIGHARFWLGDTGTALLAITVVNIWRSFPFYTISLLAALQAIPEELSEAAALDGAGMLARFRAVTWPHIRPVSAALVTIHVIWTAINFDFIWVMTEGGPLHASETLPILIYRYALQTYDVGAASALATMMIGFLVAALTVFWFAVLRPRRASVEAVA